MENVLKAFWRKGADMNFSLQELFSWKISSRQRSIFLLWRLIMQGWVEKVEIAKNKKYRLTPDGKTRASQIIRLHRLWEVYLVSLGQGVEKVHRSAEEMEHILTPELERELTLLLHDPKQDPHHQPIPARDEFQ